MILFAGFASTVFAVIGKDHPREQIHLGLRMFAGFLAVAIVLGWLMYFIPL